MRPPAALIIVLLLAGCARVGPGAGGSPTPDPTGSAPDLAGAWVLTSGIGPAGRFEWPDDYRITITFDDGEVGGQACNHYGGSYQLTDAGEISFSAMSMTEMACAEPMMSAEAAYHAALAAVNSASRSGEELTLSGEGAELSFELLPEVPDAALQDTRWVLESLVHGDAVSSVQGEPGLELNADGTLSGSTGCREFSGEYTLAGDQVVATTLVTNDNACTADLQQQDAFVLEVLADGFTVAIAGDRLTLAKPNGSGLDYRAATG
jgi:heat shock protein HslJ